MTPERLARAGAALLGKDLRDWRALAGGDLSPVLLLQLAPGGEAVAKSGPAPRAEARMLAALGAAGMAVPKVLAVSDRVLVLQRLPEDGGLSRDGWAELGAALRRQHGHTGPAYGWPEDYAFGPVPIPNRPLDDWPAFWAERRLLPGIPFLPADLARRVEGLARGLADRLPARPARSLLHGDLWAGNVLAHRGGLSGLIDPACYHGHAEVDLAMLRLFASPGPGFARGYGPLAPGAAERLPVYQLWPAIVHVRLFGAGWHGLVGRLLDQAGA